MSGGNSDNESHLLLAGSPRSLRCGVRAAGDGGPAPQLLAPVRGSSNNRSRPQQQSASAGLTPHIFARGAAGKRPTKPGSASSVKLGRRQDSARRVLSVALVAAACAVGLPPSVPLHAVGEWLGGLDEGLAPGVQAPAFSTIDLDGASQTLAQYQGSFLVLHFWATWCPYCRGEIPELTRLRQEWAARGVRVLSVSVDEDAQALKRFVAKAGLPYPVVADLAHRFRMAAAYRVNGVPVTYVIAPDGRIAERLDGAADILGTVARLRAGLSEAPPRVSLDN